MNMEDLKVEPIQVKREGMQPVTAWNDIRVTHLPSGLAVEVPHGFTTSQNRNLKVAIWMIETALVDLTAQRDAWACECGTDNNWRDEVCVVCGSDRPNRWIGR
jgi:protein subunit release factor A